MRNNLFLMAAVAVLGLLTGCSQPKSFVAQNGALHVEGTFLMNKNNQKVVLKGVSYGWHDWVYPFYNTQTVDILCDQWHCNVIRAAIGAEPKNGYINNPELGFKCVTTVADRAIERGIYVIVDWHSHHIRTQEAKDFFTKVAMRYKGVPNIIYEIFNEPVHDSWEDVKAYSVEIIDLIRRIDPNALILVGSPHWDQDIDLVADAPLSGYDNLMYTVHFYAGTHKQELRDKAQYALSKGIPLFFSECGGMNADGDGPLDYDSWAAWTSWMEANSISWAAWSLSQKVETCSMLPPTSSPTGPWADSELKEWAKLVRQSL